MATRQQVLFGRRILAVWNRATREERHLGRSWYRLARKTLIRPWADALGVTVDQFAAVTAAISPGCSWPLNVLKAADIVRAWRDGQEPKGIPTYSYENVRKALRVLDGERPADVLGGAKVTAFYRLLRDGGNARDACVDTHVMDAAVGRRDAQIRDSRHTRPVVRDVRLAVYAVAGLVHARPCTVAATVWVVWRRLKAERPER